jgi:acetate kinase
VAQVLVVNSGSSSLKYDVFQAGPARSAAGEPARLHSGIVERIGIERTGDDASVPDHRRALEHARRDLDRQGVVLDDLAAVGHRVVHGGARYTAPTLVDDDVQEGIDALSPLAPLHNPPAVAGLRVLRAAYPDVPQVAVFDTAFHASLPQEAYTYAVPPSVAEQYGVRRWGFHGVSVQYVTRRAADHLQRAPGAVHLVVCHIGNGASVTAVTNGRSVDTSMGMTPLEGLVMGTRSGDIDASVVAHLERRAGMSTDEVDTLLTRGSGLLGLCGDSDVRTVRQRAGTGDEAARRALAVYAHRLRRYVGAFLAVVPGAHAVVFTAGVGENDADLRAEVVDPLAHLGLRLDADANRAAVRPVGPVRIDDGSGPCAVLVVPTDESLEICRQALDLVARS